MRDGTLYYGKAVGRKPDQRPQNFEDGVRQFDLPRRCSTKASVNRLISLDRRPFHPFRNAQAYSFTRFDAPEPNRLLG